MKQQTIGLALHTLNEEEFIGDSLRSLAGIDGLVVMDQGSTDKTVEIARGLGADVLQTRDTFLSRGEKEFRNDAALIAWARGWDWLMVTDADEIMSDGWLNVARDVIDHDDGKSGALSCDYHQLVGSYEYHAVDSPLKRVFAVRVHPRLRGGQHKTGTMVHSDYLASIEPQVTRHIDGMSIFHCGYMKADLEARFARNINRGDYTQDAGEKQGLMLKLHANPVSMLQECVPSKIDWQAYPEALRARYGRTYGIDFDREARRIRHRTCKMGGAK